MDEAIALMNGVHNAMVQMLREIPFPLQPTGTPAGSIPSQSVP